MSVKICSFEPKFDFMVKKNVPMNQHACTCRAPGAWWWTSLRPVVGLWVSVPSIMLRALRLAGTEAAGAASLGLPLKAQRPCGEKFWKIRF